MVLFVLFAFLAVASAYSPSRCSFPPVSCSPKARCTPTCQVPNPPDCDRITNQHNCKTGTIWDEDCEKCVLIANCPDGVGCNGDPFASIREYPPPCPSTCDTPDEFPCKKLGLAYGCVCNPGYILSQIDGRCIEPNECPGGNPCGINGTFVPCQYDCPSEFCPVDDRGGEVFCNPAQCRSGCVCARKYVWVSREDRRCILSQECDEIECTRQNEAFDRCPSACFSDGCNEPDPETTPCNTLIEPECYPQCRCKPGFARENVNNLCIPKEDCPPPEIFEE